MDYPTLALGELRPRDSTQLKKKLPLHKGLSAYYFFGIFALIAPFAPILSISLAGDVKLLGWGPLLLFFMACEALSFYFLFHANKTYLRRLKGLSHGIFVKGIVKEQGRNFVFWKSSRNYTITIAFELAGKQIYHKVQSNKASLHADFPVGTELWGLHDVDGLGSCFPIEFGVLLEAPAQKQKPIERK
jgi:hypothetical protein